MMNKEIIEKAASRHAEGNPFPFVGEYFKAGANFVLNNLWQEDTDDESVLPPIGKEVIVYIPYEMGLYRVDTAYRTEIFNKFGKAGWNIPDVKYFLNAELPKCR